MTNLNTPSDALPLLACKIAPRQFDLSYRFSCISLRDQIVRAQMLIRTLVEQSLVEPKAAEDSTDFQLLIVGAGAAGLAAAAEASKHEISFILIEKCEDAPGGVLRSPAARYVSTAMYEWPHPNHKEHEFPLATPHLLGHETGLPALRLNFTTPVKIGEFGKKIVDVLQPSLAKWKENHEQFRIGKPLLSRELFISGTSLSAVTRKDLQNTLNGRISIHGIPLNEITLPAVTLENETGSSLGTFRFNYIIYAVGFGFETKNYADNKSTPYKGFENYSFWEKDSITKSKLGFSKSPRVGILGSGDGALQDALRCLVKPKFIHPLAIWDKIMEHPQGEQPPLKYSRNIDKALARIAAADTYTTAGAIWSHQSHIFESLDTVFKDIISDLIAAEENKLKEAISSILRDDVESVTIVTRNGHFTKAYALNRFLVYLFYLLQHALTKWWTGRFEILSGEVTAFKRISNSSKRGAVLKIQESPSSTPITLECDLAIIRGGLDKTTAPTQLLGLTGVDTGRAELGRIPPAIRPIESQ